MSRYEKGVFVNSSIIDKSSNLYALDPSLRSFGSNGSGLRELRELRPYSLRRLTSVPSEHLAARYARAHVVHGHAALRTLNGSSRGLSPQSSAAVAVVGPLVSRIFFPVPGAVEVVVHGLLADPHPPGYLRVGEPLAPEVKRLNSARWSLAHRFGNLDDQPTWKLFLLSYASQLSS